MQTLYIRTVYYKTEPVAIVPTHATFSAFVALTVGLPDERPPYPAHAEMQQMLQMRNSGTNDTLRC